MTILNITSIHGTARFLRQVANAATKWANSAFPRSPAIELASGNSRGNAIGAGPIELPGYFPIPGYTTDLGNQMVLWGRVGHPEDVGKAAVFLVLADADFITGQV